jgi:hypothetical protein
MKENLIVVAASRANESVAGMPLQSKAGGKTKKITFPAI